MNDTISKTFKRRLLWRFLKGSRALFLLSMLCAALSALADMLSPQIVRVTVDHVLGGKTDSLNPLIAALVEKLGGRSASGDSTGKGSGALWLPCQQYQGGGTAHQDHAGYPLPAY